jgi:hypothetical protein
MRRRLPHIDPLMLLSEQTTLRFLGEPGKRSPSRRLIATESVIHCYTGRLYWTVSERFAWGRWQRDHWPLDSFSLSLDAAKIRAEFSRAPGAFWRIKELPALVLQGTSHSIIISELDAPTPLKQFHSVAVKSTSLLLLADQFFHQRNGNVVRFVAHPGTVNPARGPFRTLSSRAPTPDFALSWEAMQGVTRRPHAVNRSARTITEHLEQLGTAQP